MNSSATANDTSHGRLRCAWGLAFALCLVACSEQLDAGESRPHGLLPVDERNPVILVNDGWSDNWSGEYALLLANGGAIELLAIVVSSSPPWPKLTENVTGYQGLLTAARLSGLKELPELITSVNSQLSMPTSGNIEETIPTYDAEGARKIIELSAERALPYRPVVVATGGALTDIANAYLIDPSVVDRVVVVSSLGSLDATGAAMGVPNGEMDPVADQIVIKHFRYIQVSAYYDQKADVPDSRRGDLPTFPSPMAPFGAWMLEKQPKIFDTPVASDQVAVLAASLPGFVLSVQNASAPQPWSNDSKAGPHLQNDPSGTLQVVNVTSGARASARLWDLLLSSATLGR